MDKLELWLAAGAFCASAGAGLLLRSAYEREQLSVERIRITSGKIKKDCTFVFLSDLHSHEFGSGNQRLLSTVKEIKPAAILIGGDMMISKETADLRVCLRLMGELLKLCPVYYGNGNHELRLNRERIRYGTLYDRYVERITDMGVVMLSNETEGFLEDVAITGIDLTEKYYRKLKPARLFPEEIERLAGKADERRFQILLCHSPLFFDACRAWGADLTLSGHFHGGTIRLPYLGGIMTPQLQFFLPWCAGEFEKEGAHMVVSRGLGTHSINIRLNNKPQVVVIDLIKEGSDGGITGGSHGNIL